MLSEGIARRIRRIIACISAIAILSVVVIVLIALSPSGNWFELEDGYSLDMEMEDTRIVIRCEAVLDSNVPYALDDVEVSLSMVDEERGSRAILFSESGIEILPGKNDLSLEASISAPTVMLIVRDAAMKDGMPLDFRLNVECGYMLGMADFSLESSVRMPVTEPGHVLEYEIVQNTEDSYVIEIEGLAGWLIPDDRAAVVSGGGETAELDTEYTGEVLRISFGSESGLDGVFDRIAASSDLRCTCNEVPFDADSDDVRRIGSLLGILEGVL